MNTQICVITNQTLANFIPILYLKPQKVIILVMQSFKNKAKEFRTILTDVGVSQSINMLDGCPDTGLIEIGKFIESKLLPILPSKA